MDISESESEGDGIPFHLGPPRPRLGISDNRPKVRRCATVPDLSSIHREWQDIQVNLPDDVHTTHTGLFEDIKLSQLTVIDIVISKVRWFWKSIISIVNGFSVFSLLSLKVLLLPFFIVYWMILYCISFLQWGRETFNHVTQAIFHPTEFISKKGMDTRTKEQIVHDSGYPYELHTVTTEDGYIITLERLPHPNSTDVLYFQHGIVDSGFTWLASGNASSLAFAAYDAGYDVFLGNFRGNPPTSHINPDISSAEYWDFSVNDHGMCFISIIKSFLCSH